MGIKYTLKLNYGTDMLQFDDWDEVYSAANILLHHAVGNGKMNKVEIFAEQEEGDDNE